MSNEHSRHSRVFHRQLRSPLPRAVGGEGVYLVDATGRRYLDACGGAAVSSLGHGHRAIVEAVAAQLDTLAYAHTAFFTTEPLEALAEALTHRAPAPLTHACFVSGGSEGIEAALKMARQYFVERGEPARTRILARRQSFHGTTLGALAAGGNFARRRAFEPLLSRAFEHVAPCFAYREQRDGESLEEYGARAADDLERAIQRLGPETVAAFVAETVVGATSGAVTAAPGYFERIRAICDRYGVLLILDEVMCGMGRTGTLFACEAERISPDLLVLGKGLAAGYQPIGAVLVADHVVRAFVDGSGAFQHGHTYMGHAAACAAALRVLGVIEEEDLLANVRRQGEHLTAALRDAFREHPHVGDVRGRGLFLAIELVEDVPTKRPFAPEERVHQRVLREALARGLMVYPMGGTIDGTRGDHVLIAPPFIVTAPETEQIATTLRAAVDAALARSP